MAFGGQCGSSSKGTVSSVPSSPTSQPTKQFFFCDGSCFIKHRPVDQKKKSFCGLTCRTRFLADLGVNLIKQGEIFTGRPCRSVAQWSECLHGMREVVDFIPGRAVCAFSSPVAHHSW